MNVRILITLLLTIAIPMESQAAIYCERNGKFISFSILIDDQRGGFKTTYTDPPSETYRSIICADVTAHAPAGKYVLCQYNEDGLFSDVWRHYLLMKAGENSQLTITELRRTSDKAPGGPRNSTGYQVIPMACSEL